MQLQTKDLDLRTVTDQDVEEVARMWAFEKGSISKDEAKKAIESMQSNYTKNTAGYIYHLCFAVFVRGTSRIIGWCGLDGKAAGKLHIFYLLDAAYRNRGYATQCAGALLAYAFDEVRVPFVNGGCDKNNIASYRVMEKTGMQQSALADNGDPLFFIDSGMYHSEGG